MRGERMPQHVRRYRLGNARQFCRLAHCTLDS
jgi:hypothetical protein